MGYQGASTAAPIRIIEARGGGATRFVAASDADPITRAMATHVCDGVDDQLVIRAAIASLPEDGGRVILSDGTFHLNSVPAPPTEITHAAAIHIDRSNVTLEGQGRSTILFLDDGQDTSYRNTVVILVGTYASTDPAVTNVVIRNLVVDANKAGQDAGNIANPQDWECVNLKYASDCVVEGCVVKNALGDGIDLDVSTRNRIDRNTSLNNDGAGIHVSYNSPRNKVINNTTSGNGVGLSRGGIEAYPGSTACIIEGNHSLGDFRGIVIGASCVVSNNVIIDHTASDSGTSGAIHIMDPLANGSVIEGNRVTGGSRGLTAVANVGELTLSNNVFRNISSTAVSLFSATGGYNVINDNSIIGAGATGISVSGPGNSITGNVLNGCGTGINLSSSASGSVVSGNILRSSSARGIDLTSPTWCLVIGNRVWGVANGEGIRSQGNYNIIRANVVTDTGGDEISATGDDNVVEDNQTGTT